MNASAPPLRSSLKTPFRREERVRCCPRPLQNRARLWLMSIPTMKVATPARKYRFMTWTTKE
ncbi:uncharacterized protein LOC144144913 isoform X2 [Haemaphysalis longicornis]